MNSQLQERIEIELLPLEEAYQRAFADYVREIQKTLALLDTGDIEAVDQQRDAERVAFERYREARWRYANQWFALIQRKGS